MLLELVFLYAKHLAVPVLVLQDVGVLLTFEPRVLQVKENWLGGLALEQVLHFVPIVFHVSGVEIPGRGTGFVILEGFPLVVGKVFEIVIHGRLVRLGQTLRPFDIWFLV